MLAGAGRHKKGQARAVRVQQQLRSEADKGRYLDLVTARDHEHYAFNSQFQSMFHPGATRSPQPAVSVRSGRELARTCSQPRSQEVIA